MWNHSTKMFTLQFLCSKTALLEGKRLFSTCFSAVGKSWWIAVEKLKDADKNSDGNEFVNMHLCASLDGPNVDVRFILRLVAKTVNKNVEHEAIVSDWVFDDENSSWGWQKFILLTTLKTNESIFCSGDKFLFEADVTVVSVDGIPVIHPPVVTFHPKTATASISDSKESHLPNDSTMPVHQYYCEHDVVVVSKCGVEFECHKYILATNSVFRNVYLKYAKEEDVPGLAKKRRSSRVEKKSEFDRIMLKDMSAHALRVVLSHIYHGSLKFDIAIAGDVLHAAETHDLPLLKRECEAFMSYSLNMDNFLDYLMIAEFTNSVTLKDTCLSFWPKSARNIMKTRVWKEFITSKDSKNVVLVENLIEQLLT